MPVQARFMRDSLQVKRYSFAPPHGLDQPTSDATVEGEKVRESVGLRAGQGVLPEQARSRCRRSRTLRASAWPGPAHVRCNARRRQVQRVLGHVWPQAAA